MIGDLLFITCSPRIVTTLADEFTAQFEADSSDARVLKYGVMNKGHDGFLLIAVPHQGFTTQFYDTLQQDDEIASYILLPKEHL